MGVLCERGTDTFTLTLPVTPRGQGRARYVSTPAGPRAYTPKASRQAQDEIRTLWSLAGRPIIPVGVPFTMTLTATFARPKSHRTRVGLSAAGRRSALPRPDVDNIAKLVLDALQGHAFPDDSMCARLTVEKRWGDEDLVVVAARW